MPEFTVSQRDPIKKSKNMAQNFQHDLETGLIQSLKDDFETKI